jgi:7-keto-8-aminopelargonate synthetase-like enzyme
MLGMTIGRDESEPALTHVSAWSMDGPPGTQTVLNGKPYLYFAGTGYLGLQSHPALIAAAQAAAEQYGIHTATSRTGFGTCPPVREVERRAAEFLGAEDALYLVSGYAGNFALAAALSPYVDLVLIDESAHYCLREATRWFDALQHRPLVFRHRDAGHVAELLGEHMRPGRRPLLLTDGIFPINGQLAPLADYLAILGQYDAAKLLVDDAHGLATVGDAGRGSMELAGAIAADINRDPDEPVGSGVRIFHTATLSKAVGGHGGVIAGSRALLDRVCRSSGWYHAASAPAAPIAAATAKGLEIVQGNPQLRRDLAANVAAVRSELQSLGLPIASGPSPILGFSLASDRQMADVQQRLAEQSIMIAFMRHYVGAGAQGMLRIAVFATHTPAMIARLVAALRQALAAEQQT